MTIISLNNINIPQQHKISHHNIYILFWEVAQCREVVTEILDQAVPTA
jgi:hypothetical protein